MRLLTLLCCIAALAAPARADDALLREALGLTGPAGFMMSGASGMVIALVRGPDTLVVGYGETAKGNGREPDGRTLVRIGSISKAFAGELLGALAADGTLRLTDTLQRYTPGATLPAAGGRPVTLLDLATHTGGLPREMPDDKVNGEDWRLTAADRLAWLAAQKLAWTPGRVAAYSNVGFDLLMDGLVSASGKPFETLRHDRIAVPVGMADTTVAPTAAQCARLMAGTGLGGPSPCVDMSGMGGSGGIYATADDMARWLRHNLQTNDAASWTTLDLTHAVYRRPETLDAVIGLGSADGLALGWELKEASGRMPTILQKNGATGGFMAHTAFAPGRGVGVFVAVNRADFAVLGTLEKIALGLIESLAPR